MEHGAPFRAANDNGPQGGAKARERRNRIAADGDPGAVRDDQTRRNPLREEYREGRLGDDVQSEFRWQAACWFRPIYETAQSPERLESCWTVLEGKLNGKPLAPPQSPSGALRGQDVYARASIVCGLARFRLRALYRPTVDAVVFHADMKDIGAREGVRPSVAAHVGRQRVKDGLDMLAALRSELVRWEATGDVLPPGTCTALGEGAEFLPASIRAAANDDVRRLKDVA